jgi:hypothetical protein
VAISAAVELHPTATVGVAANRAGARSCWNNSTSKMTRRLSAMADNISHEFLRRTATAELSSLLKRLQDNAAAIATWTEKLGQIDDWDSPAAEEIRRHIIHLVDLHRRTMGLSKDVRNLCTTCGRMGTWKGGLADDIWCDACCDEHITASEGEDCMIRLLKLPIKEIGNADET